jgi:catechol 2,3-dioxygenase-like lactoylglutathione lyase family enzyme
MRLTVNLFCRDHDACFAFYQALLGGVEIEAQRSPIFRSLQFGDGQFGSFQLGFHAPEAVTLLEATPWHPIPVEAERGAGASHYPNFDVEAASVVDTSAEKVVALGGRVVKGPYTTYYGAWQVVLADPEGHLFRINCSSGPAL